MTEKTMNDNKSVPPIPESISVDLSESSSSHISTTSSSLRYLELEERMRESQARQAQMLNELKERLANSEERNQRLVGENQGLLHLLCQLHQAPPPDSETQMMIQTTLEQRYGQGIQMERNLFQRIGDRWNGLEFWDKMVIGGVVVVVVGSAAGWVVYSTGAAAAAAASTTMGAEAAAVAAVSGEAATTTTGVVASVAEAATMGASLLSVAGTEVTTIGGYALSAIAQNDVLSAVAYGTLAVATLSKKMKKRKEEIRVQQTFNQT